MKKFVSVFIALALILCSCPLSSFATGAGDGNVTITVNVGLMGVDNPEAPFAYLRYYTDSKNHDPNPEYIETTPAYIQENGLPDDSFQTASASTVSGNHVTFLQPYYDFYSAARVDLPDGSYTTIGANPLYGYVFDHWEGWESEEDEYYNLKMPDKNEFIATRNVTLTAVFRAVEDMSHVYRIEGTSGYGDPKWTTIGDMLEEPILVERGEPYNDVLKYYSSARCGERVQITYHNLYDDGYYSDGRRSVPEGSDPDNPHNNFCYQFYMWSNLFYWDSTDRQQPGTNWEYDCVVFADPYEKNTSFLMPAGNIYIDQLYTRFDQLNSSRWEGYPGGSLLLSTTKNVYNLGEGLDTSRIHVTLVTQDYGSGSYYSRVFNKLSGRSWGCSVDPYADLYKLYVDYENGRTFPAYGDLVANDVTGCITGIFDNTIMTFDGFDSDTVGRKTVKVTYKNEPTGTLDLWVEDGQTATVTIQNNYGPSPAYTQITVPYGAEIWKGENNQLIVESSSFYKEYELEMNPIYRFESWDGIPAGGVVKGNVNVSVRCSDDLVPTYRFKTADVNKGQIVCNFDLPEEVLYTKRPGYNCSADFTIVSDIEVNASNFFAGFTIPGPLNENDYTSRKTIVPIAEPGYKFIGWTEEIDTAGAYPIHILTANFEIDNDAISTLTLDFDYMHVKINDDQSGSLSDLNPGDLVTVSFTNDADPLNRKPHNENYTQFSEWDQVGKCAYAVNISDSDTMVNGKFTMFVWLEFADPYSPTTTLRVPKKRPHAVFGIEYIAYTPCSYTIDSEPTNNVVEAGTTVNYEGIGDVHVLYGTRPSDVGIDSYGRFFRIKYKTADLPYSEMDIGRYFPTPLYSDNKITGYDTTIKPEFDEVNAGKRQYAVGLYDMPINSKGEYSKTIYNSFNEGVPASFDIYGIDPDDMFLYVYVQPDKTAYNIGEELDLTGLKIMTQYNYLTGEEDRGFNEEAGHYISFVEGFIDVTDFCTVGELDTSTSGEKYVTVEFMGMRTYFNVKVLDNTSAMSINVPEDSFRKLGENYVGHFSGVNAPADAKYILYQLDENGEKQLVNVYRAGSDGSFAISGKGKHAGTETYYVGAKFNGQWQYCSEPFSIVWTQYDIDASKTGNTMSLSISNVEAEMSVAVVNYDENGRFIGIDLSPQTTADGTRHLTLSGENPAETKLFFMKNWHSVSNGTISWNEIEY